MQSGGSPPQRPAQAGQDALGRLPQPDPHGAHRVGMQMYMNYVMLYYIMLCYIILCYTD